MEALQGACLLAATISVGLMAGVFGLYAHTIMPGVGKTDDRTFVGRFLVALYELAPERVVAEGAPTGRRPDEPAV